MQYISNSYVLTGYFEDPFIPEQNPESNVNND